MLSGISMLFLAGAALHFYDKAQQSTNQRIYELNTILARNCPEIYGEIWLCNIDTKLFEGSIKSNKIKFDISFADNKTRKIYAL